MAQPSIIVFGSADVDKVPMLADNQTFTGTNKFGSETNNVQIDASGEVTLNGTATVFEDLAVNLANVKAPAADPPGYATYKSCELPFFKSDATNSLYFTAQLPHSHKEGSNIGFHIHVVYTDADTGDSVWYFTYCWANMDGTFTTVNSETKTFAAPGVADAHKLESFTDIDGTGKTISSVLLCSISRLGGNAGDTYANDIGGISADFHIEKDTLGSKTAISK
jgi:hypothetical protein